MDVYVHILALCNTVISKISNEMCLYKIILWVNDNNLQLNTCVLILFLLEIFYLLMVRRIEDFIFQSRSAIKIYSHSLQSLVALNYKIFNS